MKQYLAKSPFAGICLLGMYIYSSQQENSDLTGLALENIEALAQNENTNHICYDYGDIECDGMKVKYGINGLR